MSGKRYFTPVIALTKTSSMQHTYPRANTEVSSASVLISQYLEPALCIAAAIMLTFGRSGLLPIFGQYTLLDSLASFFVLVMTPVALLVVATRQLEHRSTLLLLLVLGLFIAWISVVVLTVTPVEYFPSRTALISISASFIIVLQVPRFRLALVRRAVLVIACLFERACIEGLPRYIARSCVRRASMASRCRDFEWDSRRLPKDTVGACTNVWCICLAGARLANPAVGCCCSRDSSLNRTFDRKSR